ncbi:ANTAR domain-containing protein [Mycobacterium sp. UM_Kg27]|uniref:ANTAR domain-containing protein n=1 Tax=Mycobacterium sp. UM_Kg27 TaxID=1545693 RepID=UPI0009E4A1EF|nr:ANTAR domain-containing protein [Mycobacterium sp. UM_Kg27]
MCIRDRRQALVREAEQLQRAIESRDTIGQAKGALMERYDIDATTAFNLLVKISQDTNTPVAQVARKLIRNDRSDQR